VTIISYRSVCTEGIGPSEDLSGALLLPAGAFLHPLSLQLDHEETTLALLSPPSIVVQSSRKGFCPLQDNNDDLLVSSVPWCSLIGSRLPYHGHHRYPRSSTVTGLHRRDLPIGRLQWWIFGVIRASVSIEREPSSLSAIIYRSSSSPKGFTRRKAATTRRLYAPAASLFDSPDSPRMRRAHIRYQQSIASVLRSLAF
jgi:hypothetical protein